MKVIDIEEDFNSDYISDEDRIYLDKVIKEMLADVQGYTNNLDILMDEKMDK